MPHLDGYVPTEHDATKSLPSFPLGRVAMSHFTRRSFLKATLAAGASVCISGTKSSGRAYGANERIRIAIAGLHGRGSAHVSEFLKIKDVEIAYLVYPDPRQFGPRPNQIGHQDSPRTRQASRKPPADQELNAGQNLRPNHAHAALPI